MDPGGEGNLSVDPDQSLYAPFGWFAIGVDVYPLQEETGLRMRLALEPYNGATSDQDLGGNDNGYREIPPLQWTRITASALTANPTAVGTIRPFIRSTTVDAVGFGYGFRFRRVVIASDDTQEGALARVATFWDGDTPSGRSLSEVVQWGATPNASPSFSYSPVVDSIAVTRTSGGTETTVRGLERGSAVGGYLVAADHEMDLDTELTYRAHGYSGTTLVQTSTVTVSTAGAVAGAWLKVAGHAEMTVRAEIQEVGDLTSETVGGVYRIAGGGGIVAQSIAQWSGIDADRFGLTVLAPDMLTFGRVRAALTASRVLLVQCAGSDDFDSGWFYVSSVSTSLLGQVRHGGGGRRLALDLTRTGIPVGDGSGIPGVTWAAVLEDHESWADVVADVPTWFDLTRGA